MKIIPDKRLCWFLKENIELDLDSASVLDMYVQQVVLYGISKDIKALIDLIGLDKFKASLVCCAISS